MFKPKPFDAGMLDYKPGWSMGLGAAPNRRDLYVRAAFDAPDSRGSGNLTTVGAGTTIDPSDERAALRSVFRFILDLEMHEAAEWFTYRGERVFDPHSSVLPFVIVEAR